MRNELRPTLGELLARALKQRSQVWLAKRCGVTQSAVNQWLNNRTTPNRLQLAVAVITLDLDVHEAAKAAGYQAEDIREIIATITVWERDIEHAKYLVQDIYITRVTGSSSRAIDKIDGLLPWLQSKEDAAYGTSIYEELLPIHAAILVEKSLAHTELLYPPDMWIAVEPIAQEIDRLAQECGDSEGATAIARLASYQRSIYYYHNKLYAKAIDECNKALVSVNEKTAEEQGLMAHRTKAVCFAYLGEKEEFTAVRTKAQRFIATGRFSDEVVCITYDGIGRSEGLLGLPEADKTLEKGREVINTSNHKLPFRTVELIRSELEVLQRDPQQIRALEQRGQKGRELAKEYGYKKYEERIIQLLNDALNRS